MRKYYGKEKCRILKQIRAEIARQNDIEWVVSECKHQGECRGTCPRCEYEVRQLEAALARREALGKKVAVVGISAGIALSVSGCANPATPPHGANTNPATTPQAAGTSAPAPVTDTVTDTTTMTESMTVTDAATVTESETFPLLEGETEFIDETTAGVPMPPETELMGEPMPPETEEETESDTDVETWELMGDMPVETTMGEMETWPEFLPDETTENTDPAETEPATSDTVES